MSAVAAMRMYPWESDHTSPAERWGMAYLLLALAIEIFVRRVNDVMTFVVDAIAIVAGAFVGPAVVLLAAHLFRTEYHGLSLAGRTLLSCAAITVALGFTFRCFY